MHAIQDVRSCENTHPPPPPAGVYTDVSDSMGQTCWHVVPGRVHGGWALFWMSIISDGRYFGLLRYIILILPLLFSWKVCAPHFHFIWNCNQGIRGVDNGCFGNDNLDVWDPTGKCVLLPSNLGVDGTPRDYFPCVPPSNPVPLSRRPALMSMYSCMIPVFVWLYCICLVA